MSEYGLEIIEKRLKEKLVNELTRTGLLFRLFSRVKEHTSIEEKFSRKNYSIDAELMQDLVGFRITTYFSDDVKIVVELCENIFDKVELVYDEPTSEEFKPLRKNMICRMPEYETSIFEEMKPNNPQYALIDNTFEIQFRTTLSEGWHEVDHLMRYKCKQDWESLKTEGRMLNGIYATLETNDQTLKALFEDISYQHYKAKNWEAMLRNKLRLRFMLKGLDTEIIDYLNVNPEVGKKLFKLNRNKILNTYINSTLSFPINFDNLIYFINFCFLKDEFITSKTQAILKEEFVLAFNSQENK
jgi:putative GTP pyrophosphokinase